MTDKGAKGAVVTLANGERVQVRDWTSGPISDAVCSRCGRLAFLINVIAGERVCEPCRRLERGTTR